MKCNCGREQAYGRPHHITIQEAESLGWVLIEHQWVCPVCNPALAEYDIEIQVQDNRGNKASIGKYRTAVENYVLCVDVRNADMSNVLFLHIEFKGKVKKMETCPRCHKKTLEPEQAKNSLSRRGDVYICNACGDEEAFIDSGQMAPNEIEIEFEAKLQSEPDLP